VLRIQIRDPVPFFDPWIRDLGSGMGKKNQDPDPGRTVPDLTSEGLETIFCVKILFKFFYADPDPESF
jgi:hypothetical protein